VPCVWACHPGLWCGRPLTCSSSSISKCCMTWSCRQGGAAWLRDSVQGRAARVDDAVCIFCTALSAPSRWLTAGARQGYARVGVAAALNTCQSLAEICASVLVLGVLPRPDAGRLAALGCASIATAALAAAAGARPRRTCPIACAPARARPACDPVAQQTACGPLRTAQDRSAVHSSALPKSDPNPWLTVHAVRPQAAHAWPRSRRRWAAPGPAQARTRCGRPWCERAPAAPFNACASARVEAWPHGRLGAAAASSKAWEQTRMPGILPQALCHGVASADLSLWLAAARRSATRRMGAPGRLSALAAARAATRMPGRAPPRRPARCGRARPPRRAARRRGARMRRALGQVRSPGRARCGRARRRAARRRATAAATRPARPRGACSLGRRQGRRPGPPRSRRGTRRRLKAAWRRPASAGTCWTSSATAPACSCARPCCRRARAPWLLPNGPSNGPVCI